MLKKVKALLFHNTSFRQTVAKNTFWLGVSNIGGRLLRAIIIIYAARVLGAEGWGAFSYAITFVAFLTIFTDSGINAIVTREAAKGTSREEQDELLGTALRLKLVLLALGVILVIFLGPILTKVESAIPLLPIVSLVLIFDTLREFGFSVIRARERMEWEAMLFLFTNLALVGFGFFFLLIRPSALGFTYAYTLGTGLGMAATFIFLRRDLPNPFRFFSLKKTEEL